jgi:hypothetical protein
MDIREPHIETLRSVYNLGMTRDMPIMLDYWSESLKKRVFIGKKTEEGETETILVKSEEEYTSPIKQVFKSKEEYIILTENSIYIVDSKIPQKLVNFKNNKSS